MSRPRSRRRRLALIGLAAATAAGISLSTVPQGLASSKAESDATAAQTAQPAGPERLGSYDARVGSVKSQLRDVRNLVADRGRAYDSLVRSLGDQGIADFDPATGTPRNLGRLDGFLTGKSTAPAAKVALRYVRAHLAALGLTRSDLRTFRLTRDYRDVAGIHHLAWTQWARGIPVFGNGLKANVAKDGRLISLQGAPVSGLGVMAKRADLGSAMASGQARRIAAADVGGRAASATVTTSKNGVTRWANHDYAKRVWFLAGAAVRAGYATYVDAGGDNLAYQHVIDAQTGDVLYRHDTVNYDKGDALVFENYPGAPEGGTQRTVNVIKRGWLPQNARFLTGPNVVAWADVNDDEQRNSNERVQVPGSRTGPAEYKFQPFGPAASPLCSPSFKCSWNPNVAFSWERNLNADVLQGFYFDNAFHDWLRAKPFGFTPAAGNFSGDDPVLFHALDGANTDDGLPDGNHVDNANMTTPPDSIPPTMQMFLFHTPGATPAQDPFLPGSSAFDSSIILHEYTHGLSNRLVVDASGNSTLNSVQAGSMGEAWSDWYAQDYLVAKGLERDTAVPGQLLNGKYVNAGVDTQVVRTMPLDCPVETTSTRCSRLPTEPGEPAETGGYTYGELSEVIDVAEVHASGEIWGQTLWDLRNALGHRVTANVVTRAMSLSPDDPSFLDMRNSILQADLAAYGGSHRNAIWSVFAHRGMGWFAGTLDGGDAFPDEDFALPPSPETPRGTVSGQVTDGVTGEPIAGALVAIAGHDSGLTGSYVDVTDAGGRYTINHVLIGTYPRITAFGPGYELQSSAVVVDADGVSVDFDPRRDWAASSGGAAITEFDGPDFGIGCGPPNAIDLSQGAGWLTATGETPVPSETIVPKSIVIALPASITLTELAVDPTAACGAPGSTSAGEITVEASPNGTDWTEVATHIFDPLNSRFQYNDVPVDAPVEDVSFVRYTIDAPQVRDFDTNCPNGPFGGCQFMSTTEVEVFGTQTE